MAPGHSDFLRELANRLREEHPELREDCNHSLELEADTTVVKEV